MPRPLPEALKYMLGRTVRCAPPDTFTNAHGRNAVEGCAYEKDTQGSSSHDGEREQADERLDE